MIETSLLQLDRQAIGRVRNLTVEEFISGGRGSRSREAGLAEQRQNSLSSGRIVKFPRVVTSGPQPPRSELGIFDSCTLLFQIFIFAVTTTAIIITLSLSFFLLKCALLVFVKSNSSAQTFG